jgi:hypothetical protein
LEGDVNHLENGEIAVGAPNSIARAKQEMGIPLWVMVNAAFDCVCGPAGKFQTMMIGNVRFSREASGDVRHDIPTTQWDAQALKNAFCDISKEYPKFKMSLTTQGLVTNCIDERD